MLQKPECSGQTTADSVKPQFTCCEPLTTQNPESSGFRSIGDYPPASFTL